MAAGLSGLSARYGPTALYLVSSKDVARIYLALNIAQTIIKAIGNDACRLLLEGFEVVDNR